MSVTTETFKKAMGSFPTGVTITTAYDVDGAVTGMTASAFTSLSLEPYLVLMCPAKEAECYGPLTQAAFFSIHLLAGHQGELAWQFAKSGVDKTAGLTIATGPHGAPQLEGCLAYLECKHHALYDGGDHGILVGEVQYIELDPAAPAPLVYCQSRLGALPAL